MTLSCRLFGHRRQSYVYDRFIGGNGRWREKRGTRCTRCGLSGEDVYETSPLERLLDWWWWARRAPHRWWHAARLRWRSECPVCRKPERRHGRRIGDHRECDEIPF